MFWAPNGHTYLYCLDSAVVDILSFTNSTHITLPIKNILIYIVDDDVVVVVFIVVVVVAIDGIEFNYFA